MYMLMLVIPDYAKHGDQELTDPYQMHRSMVNLFDGVRPLHRVNVAERSVIVQSERVPNFDWLSSKGWGSDPIKAEAVFDPTLYAGQRWGIYVRANPIKKHQDPINRKRVHRVPLTSPEGQMEWLARKLAAAGMQMDDGDVASTGELLVSKSDGASVVATVDYKAVVTITDGAAATAARIAGIGAAKAWGCGLLTMMRLKDRLAE